MPQTSFHNRSYHKQILDLLKNIFLEREKHTALSDIFQRKSVNEALVKRNFFAIPFIHETLRKKGSLLYNPRRWDIFYREFLRFIRLRRHMGPRYLYRLFPKGEEGEERFDAEALLILSRFSNGILHAFEVDILESLTQGERDLGKLRQGELMAVLTKEGLEKLHQGVALTEIMDQGLMTYISEDQREFPENIGRDENGNMFPLMYLFGEDGDLSAVSGLSWEEVKGKGFLMEKMLTVAAMMESHGLMIVEMEGEGDSIQGTYHDGDADFHFEFDVNLNVVTLTTSIGESRTLPMDEFTEELERFRPVEMEGALSFPTGRRAKRAAPDRGSPVFEPKKTKKSELVEEEQRILQKFPTTLPGTKPVPTETAKTPLIGGSPLSSLTGSEPKANTYNQESTTAKEEMERRQKGRQGQRSNIRGEEQQDQKREQVKAAKPTQKKGMSGPIKALIASSVSIGGIFGGLSIIT